MTKPKAKPKASLPQVPATEPIDVDAFVRNGRPSPVAVDDGYDEIVVEPRKPYLFRLGGEAFRLPNMQDLPIGIKNTIGKAVGPLKAAKDAGRDPAPADLQAFGEAQMKLLENYAPGIMDKATERELVEVLRRWMLHSGIDLGESQPSAG